MASLWSLSESTMVSLFVLLSSRHAKKALYHLRHGQLIFDADFRTTKCRSSFVSRGRTSVCRVWSTRPLHSATNSSKPCGFRTFSSTMRKIMENSMTSPFRTFYSVSIRAAISSSHNGSLEQNSEAIFEIYVACRPAAAFPSPSGDFTFGKVPHFWK